MSTYKLTPQERKARAQALVAQRKAISQPRKVQADNIKTKQTPVQSAGTLAKKHAHTVWDLTANVLTGALKSLEGAVYDLPAGIVGAIGGIFSDDFQEGVKDTIAYDAIGTWIGDPLDEALSESWLEDGKTGQIVESVAQGVGQMLPAVILTVATAGGGAPVAVSQAISLAHTGISAAGTAAEEAYNEGAGYYEGLGYGAASGAVEVATEKLFGANTSKLFGRGLLDGIGKSVAKESAESAVKATAKVGARRVIGDMIEEGVEEAAAELVNPALKSIYKGRDAFSEYGEGEYWQGVGESALVGGLTSAAYGGTIGRIRALGGASSVEQDARSVNDDINRLTDEMRSLEEKGELTPEKETRIKKTIKADIELLSKQLQKASEKKRAAVLNDPTFSTFFESDGSVRADANERMDAAIAAASDTSSGLDRRYYSESARGREQEIIDGLAAQGTKVVEGELTADEAKAYAEVRRAHNKLRSLGFVETDLVLAESMPSDKAYLDGRTVVLGRDTLSNGEYIKSLVHETTHFTEGTQEWSDVCNYIFGKDGSSLTSIFDKIKTSGYGVTQEDINTVLKSVREGKLMDTEFTEKQLTLISEAVAMKMEETFSDERSVNRLVNDNPSLAKRIWERIKALVDSFGKSKEEKEQLKQLRKTEELFRKALENAGVEYVNNEIAESKEENVTKHSLKIHYTDGTVEEIADARDLTNEQAIDYLKQAKSGKIQGHSYIPVRKDTPQVIIDTLAQVNENVSNRSLVMQVRKAQQAMSTKKSDTRVRSHGLNPEQIVEIVNELDEPTTAIYQTNRQDKNGKPLPNNVAFFVEYNNNAAEGVAVIEFDSSIDPNAIGTEFGDRNYHTVVTVFEPDVVRNGMEFDYVEELLSNPNNIELEIKRRLPARSATREKHPNTSSKLPSNDSISQISEKSTVSNEKVSSKIRESRKTTDNNVEISEREVAELVDKNSEKAYNDNIKNKKGVTYGEQRGKNSEILAESTVSTIDGSENNIWEQSKNTSKLKGLLGYSNEYVRKNNIRAGDTGWLEDYQGANGFGEPNDKQKARRFLQSFHGKLSRTELNQNDTVGRKLPLKILQDFSSTVFKTEDGTILSLWHWTNKNFSHFEHGDIGFHAGIFDASHSIMFAKSQHGESGYFKELYFNSKNPLFIDRDLMKWTPHLVAVCSNLFNNSEIAQLSSLDGYMMQEYNSAASIRLREMLKEKGYDSIVYTNDWEGGLSVIAFDDEQFYTVAENGIEIAHEEYLTTTIDEDIGSDASQKTGSNVKHSRKVDFDSDFFDGTAVRKVTITEGKLAKLRANYQGEKVFNLKDIENYLENIEALKIVPKKRRKNISYHIFHGYNVRIDSQGYETFSNIMYDKIHSLVLNSRDVEMTDVEVDAMDEQIVNTLNEIVASGKDSIKTQLEKSISHDELKKQADYWREEHNRATEQIKIRGRILSKAQRIKDLKSGAYVNASQYKSDVFKGSIEKLARIQFRGNMNVSGTRGIINELNEWYDANENALYSGVNADKGVAGRFNNDIKSMMTAIANGKGAFTTNELLCIEKIVSYFVGEIETYNTILKNGKRVEALPIAKTYIEKAKQLREIQLKCGILRAMIRNKYAIMVSDPATLMRQADCYTNGFFSDMFDELRQGEITSAVNEMELTQEFQEFWKKNSSYRKHYNNATIEINGKEIPLGTAISLYMTYQRKHAQAGLVLSGFDILDKEKKITVYKGTNEELTEKQIRKIAKQRADELYSKFTDGDKKLISIMERAFEKCRKLKIEVDMALQHYTNVDNNDYYFPIVRSQIAQNVDMFSIFEGDRVSNLSMNKDTVKGAKNALLLEPAHIVFMRHIKATSLYSGLGIFTDNFNRLFNLNVNGIQETFNSNINFLERSTSTNSFNPEGKTLKNQLQEAFDSSNSKDQRYIYVGEFTSAFTEKMKAHLNIKNIPIVMNYRDAYLSMRSKESGKYQGEGINYHNLGVDGLESALSSIADPQYVLLSPKEGKIELVLQGKDYKNRPLLSIVEVNTHAQNNDKFMAAHVITSVYGNKSIDSRIAKAKNEGRLLYTKEESTQGITQVQYESNINVNSSNNRVTQNSNVVNTFSEKSNYNRPETIKSTLEADQFTKAMVNYFTEIKKDIEGISTKEQSTKFFNDAVRFIRSTYAKYQLGANPKVWFTQLSSFFAASNLLDYSSIVKGWRIKDKNKEVDKYCKLAWLRNVDNMAVKAQAVTDKIDKLGDFLMMPIGKVDRAVIVSLFGACQIQVEKDQKLALGTEENKKAAGELLEKVILETQQNSLASERSAAMRSNNDLLKSFTMFSADALKVFSRVIDAFGEREVLRYLIRNEKDPGKKAEYEARLKEVNKLCARSISSLVMTSTVTALIALAFKWWYRRNEEESFLSFCADVFGNMLGGIPFIRDIYSFFADGYEMENFMMSTFNDVLAASLDSFTLISSAASGKDVSEQEIAGAIRKIFYAAGQMSGIPVRNAYNFVSGNINRFFPSAGYKLDSMFYEKSYKSDLAKAIENEDEDMISTIAGLMLNENIGGIESESARKELDRLITNGHDVIPRSVSDTITYNGEVYTLDAKQKKAFKNIYGIANESLAELVKLARYQEATDEVKAKAIKYIFDIYYNLALQDLVGEDFENKTVLFAEAIDIEKLALIVATARSLEADTDKNGKTIHGSRKRKIQAYIGSLRMKAAEKYMLMGFLGYRNINGEAQVKAHINGLKLTKDEKEKLLEYSGYSA